MNSVSQTQNSGKPKPKPKPAVNNTTKPEAESEKTAFKEAEAEAEANNCGMLGSQSRPESQHFREKPGLRKPKPKPKPKPASNPTLVRVKHLAGVDHSPEAGDKLQTPDLTNGPHAGRD